MSQTQPIDYPNVLPMNQYIQTHLTSSDFLPSNIWKIVFSPCAQYLAIPKQDIYGRCSLLVLKSSNWHSYDSIDRVPIEHNFFCESTVWSLSFGRCQLESNKKFDTNQDDRAFSHRNSPVHCPFTMSSVNRRYDLTKDLFLAAGLANGKINIWNITTGELTLILKDHVSTVCGLDLSSSSMQLASSSCDKTIKLWNLLDDGNMYRTLNDWQVTINSVKWSPDETLLCAVGPHELAVIYNTNNWEILFNLKGHLNTVSDCAFSSDSSLLVTASHDTRVCVWSTFNGDLLKEYKHVYPNILAIYAGGDNGSFIRSVCITKNDQFVITVCDDNKMRWFPLLANYSTKIIFECTENNGLCVVTTSDGRTIAISTRNGEVHLLSSLSTVQSRSASSLRSILRQKINSNIGYNRQNLYKLPLAAHLIHYLSYRDIRVK